MVGEEGGRRKRGRRKGAGDKGEKGEETREKMGGKYKTVKSVLLNLAN